MQFRHDFSNMENQEAAKKRKDRIPTKKELLNSLNQENVKEEDKWSDLKFYKKDSMQSYQIFEKLFCEKISKNPETPLLSQEDYLKMLFKNINSEALTEKLNEKVYQIEKIISACDILKLPFQSQVEVLFKKAFILSFDILLNILRIDKEPNDNKKNNLGFKNAILNDFKAIKEQGRPEGLKTEKELLELILKHAQVLNSGNFIYKSELKYDYVSDPKKKEFLIKQRNTIINIFQTNAEKGIKKAYFVGANEDVLNDVINECCQNNNGFYTLREAIFNKATTQEFIKKYQDIYFNGLLFWKNFSYDKEIKIKEISDKELYSQFEEAQQTSLSRQNKDFSTNKKRKLSLSYANLAVAEEVKIKSPLALNRNHSSKELIPDSGYRIERSKLNNKAPQETLLGNSRKIMNDIYPPATKNIDNVMDVDDGDNLAMRENSFNKADSVFVQENYKPQKPVSANNQNNTVANADAEAFTPKPGKDRAAKAKDIIEPDDRSQAGLNLELLKESILKNFNFEIPNKKIDLIKTLYEEFPELKSNSNSMNIINELIKQLFIEINSSLFIKELDDPEANRVWEVLLELFQKSNSYKKTEIKKALNQKDIQITDQNLNKLLKRLAFYSNQSWNFKE